MTELFTNLIKETLQVTILVAFMMILVDLINVVTKQKLKSIFSNVKQHRQYFLASLIGTVPGCIGGFTNVSLYMHGLISFGALAGAMVAVSGDEAFVIIAMIPNEAPILFSILFALGVISGYLIDFVVKKYKIKTCTNCSEMKTHESETGVKHFIKEHIFHHIVKKHLWKIAIWTFVALAFVKLGLQYLNLEEFTSQYTLVFLLLSAVVGLIPESGPHLFFVSLFAQGLVPFSVLLTSSIVQDGHGMLPMLSYSMKDTITLKIFNLVIGISVGLIFYFFGL